MASSIWASYPPSPSDEQLNYLVQTTKDWAINHSLAVRPKADFVDDEKNPNQVLATNAPVTLFPSPFPRKPFEQARSLQKVYNELYATIASDEEWLNEIMKEIVEVDDFVANLWKIHLLVKKEGYAHDLSLGMFRSDYMQHIPDEQKPPSLQQVEFNTISSSFGGLAAKVAQLHTELATFPSVELSAAYPPHPLFNRMSQTSDSAPPIMTTGIPPPNIAVETLVGGLAAAHAAYGSSKVSPSLPTCVLFLVQDNERNLFDQMALSTYLWAKFKVPSFRLKTSNILSQTIIPPTIENPLRPLIYTSPSGALFEVSTVYFRALYAPSEYDTPTSWAARHHLERSAAIKCPTILLQLSGCKKIQQVLTIPGVLERFMASKHTSLLEQLRSSFAPQYSMSEGLESEGVKIALDEEKCHNHVLKPQREGGGNNIYRSNIPSFLKSIPENQWKGYILMELIKPPSAAKNTVLKSDGEVVSGNVVSELGIFGTCLWRSKAGHTGLGILQNEEGGYLLRTKGKDSDEGGVAAGFSSLDSLILYDEM